MAPCPHRTFHLIRNRKRSLSDRRCEVTTPRIYFLLNISPRNSARYHFCIVKDCSKIPLHKLSPTHANFLPQYFLDDSQHCPHSSPEEAAGSRPGGSPAAPLRSFPAQGPPRWLYCSLGVHPLESVTGALVKNHTVECLGRDFTDPGGRGGGVVLKILTHLLHRSTLSCLLCPHLFIHTHHAHGNMV